MSEDKLFVDCVPAKWRVNCVAKGASVTHADCT
jgi:hypothetical protein